MKENTVIDPHSSFEQLKGPIGSTKCEPLRIILDQKRTLKGSFFLYQYFMFHEPEICGLLDLPTEVMFALII
jgi:hypothetical protein